jgi:hypothetical protein
VLNICRPPAPCSDESWAENAQTLDPRIPPVRVPPEHVGEGVLLGHPAALAFRLADPGPLLVQGARCLVPEDRGERGHAASAHCTHVVAGRFCFAFSTSTGIEKVIPCSGWVIHIACRGGSNGKFPELAYSS